jgi:3-oxoacyl-[acyl-carrier protein] reductase
VEDLLDMKGRIALVTGAGQGVGRETALYLAAHGAGVVVNDYYGERAEAVAAEIEAAGGRAVGLQCDITDHDAVRRLAAEAEQALGPVDILVNNAGNAGVSTAVWDAKPFWETGPDEWRPWVDVNFFGVLNCTNVLVGGMVERGFGRVVTVISDAGRVGEPNLVVYSGAKAGAAGFVRALAKAVGRHGVTANCVALSAMRTPATASVTDDPETLKKMLRPYVIRRLGEPADAAALILFLASDASSWITGQTYPVNGGYALAQ